MKAAARDTLTSLMARNRELRTLVDQRAELVMAVTAVQRLQSARLEHTYADLEQNPRYRAAVRFFLEELYGTHDFSLRDGQLERAYPKMRRILPQVALDTLSAAIELQVLSAELDLAMAVTLTGQSELSEQAYADAYRSTGKRPARRHQIALVVRLAWDLDRLVRNPFYYAALRMAHGPANLAGFRALQQFLERGFDAFRHMRGVGEFVEIIEDRETTVMENLFEGLPQPFALSSEA